MKQKVLSVSKAIATLLLLVSGSAVVYFLINLNILSFNKLILVILGVTLVTVGLIFGMFYSKIIKVIQILSIVVAILVSSFGFVASYFIGRTTSGIGRLTQTTMEKTIQVLTLKENNATSLKDLALKTISMSTYENKFFETIKNKINEQQTQVSFERVETYPNLLKNLIEEKDEYILVDPNQISELKKEIADFDSKVKVIYESKIQATVSNGNKVSNIAKTPFIVYITGIDTYGDVSEVSRSDVNILLVVNPVKNELLVVNMPRDLFVYIPRVNDYDKLTHTGLMGPDAGIETLEKFFDNKINYYMRLNFTSIINLVDALGGVTVNNPKQFYTGTWLEEENRILFKEGELNLNGREAMVYARERLSLPEGDIDRGRNQRRIIEGIITKMTSSQILFSFDSILSSLEKMVQTDMGVDQMMELIRHQIDNRKPWKIYTSEIKGEYGMSGGYYAPRQKLSVAFPIIESRLDVINQIEHMLNGESVSEKTIEVGTVDYSGAR